MKNQIIQGNALSVLRELPSESVDSVITSPPYYGLRDYGTAKWEGGNGGCDHQIGRNTRGGLTEFQKGNKGGFGDEAIKNGELCPKCGAKRIDRQLGLEKTLDEYLNKMLLITAELKRVLKKTGTMWWNHGDSYGGSNQGRGQTKESSGFQNVTRQTYYQTATRDSLLKDLTAKCMLMQNYRLIIRMIDEQQWILRNTIIWHKPNCMPSSVKDRFTVDYEPVFFFSKSKKYWFETQYEKYELPMNRWGGIYTDGNYKNSKFRDEKKVSYPQRGRSLRPNDLGRNKRCVWKIATQPFKEAHFATFPEKLIEPMVKAGCPEFICKKCGKARERTYKTEYKPFEVITNGKVYKYEVGRYKNYGKYGKEKNGVGSGKPQNFDRGLAKKVETPIGYTDCNCNAGWDSGIVLDPFMGAGTTAVVAKKLKRNYLGIELNPDYIKIAEKRIKDIPETLF